MTETGKKPLLTPEEIAPATELLLSVRRELDRLLLGRTELHTMVLVGILSRGHILLEGMPGLGKTALVNALGQLMDLTFRRVQFTPDLMPGDILGSHILQESAEGGRELVFQQGPIFTNILLADEINRASPKTQSALLEAMQERHVTLMGTTRKLPLPFFVLASQNPVELEGTYPLPEAQLDRFLLKLSVESPEVDTLEAIITTRRRGELPPPEQVLDREKLTGLFAIMEQVALPKAVARYISRVVVATHPEREEATDAINRYVEYGASPRAAIALAEASRAVALLDGRPTVGFEDVKRVAPAVLNHRLILNYQARFDKMTPHRVIAELLQQLNEAGLNLPSDITVGDAG